MWLFENKETSSKCQFSWEKRQNFWEKLRVFGVIRVDFSRGGKKGPDQIEFLARGVNDFDQIAGTMGSEEHWRYLQTCVVGRVKETMCNKDLWLAQDMENQMNAGVKRGCCRGKEGWRKARLYICQNFLCMIRVPPLCWFHHCQKVITEQIFGEWRVGEGKYWLVCLLLYHTSVFWKSKFALQTSMYNI